MDEGVEEYARGADTPARGANHGERLVEVRLALCGAPYLVVVAHIDRHDRRVPSRVRQVRGTAYEEERA